MNLRSSLILRFTLLAGAACLASSCSTGVFFADDNQEGHVGFLSATQYRDVSDVLIVKKGAAPKLTEAVQPKPPEIAKPVAVATVIKTDTLMKNDTAMAVDSAAPRYDIPILEARKQPVTHSTFVSSPQ